MLKSFHTILLLTLEGLRSQLVRVWYWATAVLSSRRGRQAKQAKGPLGHGSSGLQPLFLSSTMKGGAIYHGSHQTPQKRGRGRGGGEGCVLMIMSRGDGDMVGGELISYSSSSFPIPGWEVCCPASQAKKSGLLGAWMYTAADSRSPHCSNIRLQWWISMPREWQRSGSDCVPIAGRFMTVDT